MGQERTLILPPQSMIRVSSRRPSRNGDGHYFREGIAALVSYARSDRLLMGSPLRRRGVCLVTSATAIVVLAFATSSISACRGHAR